MPRQRVLDINVETHEVLVGPRRLKVRARTALDPDIARGAITLGSVPAKVSLSDGGRTASLVPDYDLPPGPHTLIVGELVSARRKRHGTFCCAVLRQRFARQGQFGPRVESHLRTQSYACGLLLRTPTKPHRRSPVSRTPLQVSVAA
jgi:hypothetical protein